MEPRPQEMVNAATERFPEIAYSFTLKKGSFTITSGKRYVRDKFRISLGRGDSLESMFKPEVMQEVGKLKTEFTDWRVAINYEIEKKATVV
ncbi:MAG: hypothetical protein OES26_20480 [Gammaproteobacteria bacterium]|nr:hypothetical protein [Gammaproteobacteria bacterium]